MARNIFALQVATYIILNVALSPANAQPPAILQEGVRNEASRIPPSLPAQSEAADIDIAGWVGGGGRCSVITRGPEVSGVTPYGVDHEGLLAVTWQGTRSSSHQTGRTKLAAQASRAVVLVPSTSRASRPARAISPVRNKFRYPSA